MTAPTTIKLYNGYSRAKYPPAATYRYMTPEEAKLLHVGDLVPFLSNDGTARMLRVNGKPRTWVRDPSRVEVPCKYGLYECATFEARSGKVQTMSGAALLVRA